MDQTFSHNQHHQLLGSITTARSSSAHPKTHTAAPTDISAGGIPAKEKGTDYTECSATVITQSCGGR